jgi:hypothetical protein
MNFDLMDTPTLQAVATADERLLVQDMEKRIEEALKLAEEQAEVVEAAGAQREAESRFDGLQAATRALNQEAKSVRQAIAVALETSLEGLIRSAAAAGKPNFGTSQELAALEHNDRMVSRALERLVEHLAPLAEIGKLRAEAHTLVARGRALERIAHERAEKVLSQLREAVSEEMVLPVDMSKGVAGALLARAGESKRRAVEISANADRLENWYMDQGRNKARNER